MKILFLIKTGKQAEKQKNYITVALIIKNQKIYNNIEKQKRGSVNEK